MAQRKTHIRYLIVVMLLIASSVSYGDRVALSIAGTALSRDISLDPLKLGYLFSGFSWAYVIGQLPSGGLLDRFGSKRVYGWAIIVWSISSLLTGFAGYVRDAFIAIFVLRLVSGLVQSPVFPGNGRIVAAWFPASERGRASQIFNTSQYSALMVFAPLLGWITHVAGWKACFWFMAGLGFVLAFAWYKTVYDVKDHPRISQEEITYIEEGGGLVNAGPGGRGTSKGNPLTWRAVGELLRHRMLIGIYLGQYGVTTLTWFALTWFPVYLAQGRHMSIVKAGFAAIAPGLCGAVGCVLGGVVSDRLLRAGYSLTFSRKVPIIFGMALGITIIGCNYVSGQALMLFLMSLAFFGKGFGSMGWTLVADTAPKGMVGMNGALFNLIGNMAGITTPIIIGFIVKTTGSFNDVLIFVAAAAALAIVGFVPVMGEIKRLEIRPRPQAEPA